MPTKTVIFSDMEKFSNNGLRYLRVMSIIRWQRAGRRGLDKFGTVLLMPTFKLPTENELRMIMSGKVQN